MYLDEEKRTLLVTGNNPVSLHIGTETPVILEKMYGPVVAASLRITATYQGWVIDREMNGGGKFAQWCVIPIQIPEDFDED